MQLPSSPGPSWWRYLATFCFIALLWLVAATTGHGQSEQSSSPATLSETLTLLSNLSNQLELRLQERQQEVTTLQSSLEQARQSVTASQASLQGLEAQLTTAQESLSTLQADLLATSTSLAESQASASSLSSSYEAYKGEMALQVAQVARERTGWMFTAIGAGIVAVLALVAFFVK